MTEFKPWQDTPWHTAALQTGLRSAPFDSNPCECRATHAPPVPWTHAHHLWPLYAGGSDSVGNIVYVCPPTHDWIHIIWRWFEKEGFRSVRKSEWPHYAYEVAVQGWQRMLEQR